MGVKKGVQVDIKKLKSKNLLVDDFTQLGLDLKEVKEVLSSDLISQYEKVLKDNKLEIKSLKFLVKTLQKIIADRDQRLEFIKEMLTS